jgi:transcriptional regulator with XRE-family HTH domain
MSNLSHPLSGLRDRRRLAGVTSSAIAARIGVDVNSYGRFERGERRCYLDKAIAIASMLNCTVEQLGHPPSIEERVDMFRAGEKHRELVGQARRHRAIAHRGASPVSTAASAGIQPTRRGARRHS